MKNFNTPDLSRAPLYAQIYDLILSRIVRQEYAVGAFLPNEYELANAYGVSVGTIRKAVDRLVSEGIVARLQGRGTQVTNRCWSEVDQKGDEYRHADKDASQSWRYEQYDFARQKPTLQVCEKLGLDESEAVYFSRRLRTSPQGVKIYERIYFPASRFVSGMDNDGPRDAVSLARSNGVIVGLMQDDIELVLSPEEASAAMNLPLGTPMIRTSRITHDKAGAPIEFRTKYAFLAGAALRITH